MTWSLRDMDRWAARGRHWARCWTPTGLDCVCPLATAVDEHEQEQERKGSDCG